MTANQPETSAGTSVRWALAGLSTTVLLSSLGTSIANVALPTLARAFSAPFQDVQWVVLAYLLAITVLIVSVGRLGDMVGRRRLLLAGIGLFTVASVLCGMAPALWLLVAARAAQGLGAAIMLALAMAAVGETMPKNRTGSAMGLLGTMSAVGTALGPTLGGVLLANLGWQAIFLVNLPLGVAAFVLIWRTLPVDRAAKAAAGFDVLGTLLLALTLAAYALSMTTGRGSFGLLNAGLLAVAIAGAGVFIFAQTKARSPLIRPAMFRDPALSAGLVTSAVVATVMMATLVVGPFYLSGALHLDAAAVGLAMSVGPLVAAVAGVPAGRIVDRFGARRASAAGLAAMALGCLALALVPATVGVAGYVAPIATVTAGYALFQAANNAAVMAGAGADQRGLISGLLNLSRNLGLITGASAMGAVFASAAGTADVASATAGAVTSGMQVTFGVAAGLIMTALVVMAGGQRLRVPTQLEGRPGESD